MRHVLLLAALLSFPISSGAQSVASDITLEQTRAIVEAYAADHDPSYLAEDAVFIDIATGQRYEGREAIGQMLHYIYQVAFDARAEDARTFIGEGAAAIEAMFVGTHTGDFAGVAATGRDVRVPLVVIYDVNEDGITEGRIYLQAATMMRQLGVGVE